MDIAHPFRRSPRIDVEPFGALEDGRLVDLFVLTAPRGIEARITNYGGIIVGLRTPDRDGKRDDIVLGFEGLLDYVRDTRYLGCLIGRYANRIAHGSFALDGERVVLEKNDGEHHLHGGSGGFHKVLWHARPFDDERGSGVELSHRSDDGDGGYPGNLSVNVTYVLTEGGEFLVDYDASSDRDTVLNLTQHSYFNLDGAHGGHVLDHDVVLRAQRFTPSDGRLIPTGELRNVAGTAFDFTVPTRIGDRIDKADEQLIAARGYDHNWILDNGPESPRPVARASSRRTGRVLEVSTTEPGLQFYTGNFLGGDRGKNGALYVRQSGFCMEPQHFPDSPNQPHFPSTVLRKGARYRSTTVYRFSILAASGEQKPGW